MKRYVLPALLLVALLVSAVAPAQQVKKARNATITSQSMELDWNTGEVEFIGNVKMVLTGDINADLTAPRVSVKLTPKGDRVLSAIARGPVHVTIVTAPNAAGQRRKIVASAQQEATYNAVTQQVHMTGEAVADMVPLEGAPGPESVHFTGQSIVANLLTSRLTVDNANLTVQTQ